MAKYYGIGGKRKGSVGNETYSILRGENIVKGKVIQVNDAKTPEQLEQRSKLQNSVKAYQNIGASFLKKCFEFKKPRQSTYNAFVSVNAKLAEPFFKKYSDNKNVIGIGNFEVSNGSLPVFPIVKTGEITIDGKSYVFHGVEVDKNLSAESSVGAVSESLKTLYHLTDGMIVNAVSINNEGVHYKNDNEDPLTLDEVYRVEKATQNFVIKSEDNDNIKTKGFTIVGGENNKYLVILAENSETDFAKGCVYTSAADGFNNIGYCSYFVSNKNNNKILVSTAKTKANKGLEDLIAKIEANPVYANGWLSTAMKILIITSYGVKKVIEIIRDWPI